MLVGLILDTNLHYAFVLLTRGLAVHRPRPRGAQTNTSNLYLPVCVSVLFQPVPPTPSRILRSYKQFWPIHTTSCLPRYLSLHNGARCKHSVMICGVFSCRPHLLHLVSASTSFRPYRVMHCIISIVCGGVFSPLYFLRQVSWSQLITRPWRPWPRHERS